jgi:hypothetical protein
MSKKKVELSKKFLNIYKNVKKQRKMMEELMIHENKRLQGEESSDDGEMDEINMNSGIKEIEMKDLKVE